MRFLGFAVRERSVEDAPPSSSTTMGLVLLPVAPPFCPAALFGDTSMAGIMDFLAALAEDIPPLLDSIPALPEPPSGVDFRVFKALATLLEAMPVPSAVDFFAVFDLLCVAFSELSREVEALLSAIRGSSLSDEDGDEALIRITSDESDFSDPLRKAPSSSGCGDLKIALSPDFCFLGLLFGSSFLPFSFRFSCKFGITLHGNNLMQII